MIRYLYAQCLRPFSSELPQGPGRATSARRPRWAPNQTPGARRVAGAARARCPRRLRSTIGEDFECKVLASDRDTSITK